MKEEEISKARNQYLSLKEKKKNLLSLKKQLQELKKNEIVKQYLKLVEKCNQKVDSEETIINKSFKEINLNDQNTKIYIYMGAYKHNIEYQGDDYYSNVEIADYFLYRNLDNPDEYVNILPDEKKNFEKSNIVLNSKVTLLNSLFYEEIRNYYLKLLVKGKCQNTKETIPKLLLKTRNFSKKY